MDRAAFCGAVCLLVVLCSVWGVNLRRARQLLEAHRKDCLCPRMFPSSRKVSVSTFGPLVASVSC